jgi:hypothetical protein
MPLKTEFASPNADSSDQYLKRQIHNVRVSAHMFRILQSHLPKIIAFFPKILPSLAYAKRRKVE